METIKLKIKDSYNLILSNLHKRYSNLIDNNYIVKIEQELELINNKYNDLSLQEKKDIRSRIIEEVKEDAYLDLPKYYIEENNSNPSNLSTKEKYNLYMMENSYKGSLGVKYFENTYLSKKNDQYFLIKINSEETLKEELNKTTREEELDLFYDYTKIEIKEEDFKNLFNSFLNNLVETYFINNGTEYSIINNKIKLTEDTNKNIDKSILIYLLDKQESMFKKMNKELYPRMNFNKFKDEFINGKIPLNNKYIDGKLHNTLSMILPILINNEIDEISFDEIKNKILIAKKDFNLFLIENKSRISDIVVKLLEIDLSSNIIYNKVSFNEKTIEQKNNLKNFSNKYNPKNEIETTEWNIIKGFAYEKLFSNNLFYKSISNDNYDFPNRISKVVGDKIYSIDFLNKDIIWGYTNEEKDHEHYENQKNLFNTRKVELMSENKNISKEQLKEELNPILSRNISSKNFIEEVNYNEQDFLNSKYFLLNSILIKNTEFFIEAINNERKTFNERYDIFEYKNINEYKNKDNLQILIDISRKHNISKSNVIDINKIISKNKVSDLDLIDNLIDFIDDDIKDSYKSILIEYFSILQEKMILDLKFSTNNISNSDLFKNEYYVNKLLYIMQKEINDVEKLKEFDLNELNTNSIDIFDFEEPIDIDNFFNNIDNEIIDNIDDVDSFMKEIN